MSKVVIVGAGLCGLSCAIHLAKIGFNIEVFEKRSLKEIFGYKNSTKTNRNLSLDISARGIFALKHMQIFEQIKNQSIPMKCKIFHDKRGNLKEVNYGFDEEKYILTVSREFLFKSLLEKCEDFKNITINFSRKILKINDNENFAIFSNEHEEKKIFFDILIGTDGINSDVRNFIEQKGNVFLKQVLPKGYKELFIPKINKKNFYLNATHIWPRDGFLLIGQPNLDESFSCALIMDKEKSKNSFEKVIPEKIRIFFEKNFSDVEKLIPDLEIDYRKNPIGNLQVITSKSIQFAEKIFLMGDAAHAMAPFLGQGVNCCFEDCSVLIDCLEKSNNNLKKTIKLFDEKRVKNINSIVKMSSENYPELISKIDIDKEILNKQIDVLLMKKFPKYKSFHSLVCFERLDYFIVDKLKDIQKLMLEQLSENISNADDIDINKAKLAIDKYEEDVRQKGLSL